MTKRFNPPAAPRASAVAIALALAAFAGAATAQPSSKPVGQPGYVTNASGDIVKNNFGGCVVTGQAPAPGGGACPPSASAAAASGTGAGSTVAPATAATARSAASGSTATTGGTATTARGMPGYAVASDGRVVQSGFGHCVRAGHWSPANAAEPCDRIAVAEVPPPPPVPVVRAEPKPEPAPAPAPQALAQPEPPRPVIQKVTLSTDVLFDFNKAELKEAGKERLDQLLGEIKDANVDEIIATGHADRIASEDYNQKLSEARAQAVKDYLESKVAKANRVTAEGKGESQPITGDDCKKMGAERAANKKLVTCLQPDRRVEIEVLGTREVAGGAPAAAGATR